VKCDEQKNQRNPCRIHSVCCVPGGIFRSDHEGTEKEEQIKTTSEFTKADADFRIGFLY